MRVYVVVPEYGGIPDVWGVYTRFADAKKAEKDCKSQKNFRPADDSVRIIEAVVNPQPGGFRSRFLEGEWD